MNPTGSVEEDDLILYAMQALPPSEMAVVALRLQRDAGSSERLAEIQLILGTYAEAAVDLQEVPSAALANLQQSIRSAVSGPVPVAPRAESRPAPVAPEAESRPRWRAWAGWLGWSGWAVAACLLVVSAIQFRNLNHLKESVASGRSELRETEARATTALSERDRSSAALRDETAKVEGTRQQAAEARDRSAALSAQVAGEASRAQREAGRADALAASAESSAAAQERLREELSTQAATAAQAQSSQETLLALTDPTALRVTLTVPKQKKRPSGRGVYLARTGALVFTASDLNAVPAGRVYELWLMPSDGSAPISAGTFTPDAQGNATLVSKDFRRDIAAKGFAVTLEPAGGSQKPTLPILLAGNA